MGVIPQTPIKEGKGREEREGREGLREKGGKG
jgi:hypothetical protein